MSYWVIEFKDNNYKNFDSFGTHLEASEFIKEQIEYYKKVGFKIKVTKYKYYRDGARLMKYALLRNKIKHNISFTIVKTPKNNLLEETILSDKLFGNLTGGRKYNLVLRVNDDELDILNEVAKKYEVKISTIVRACLMEVVGKVIK